MREVRSDMAKHAAQLHTLHTRHAEVKNDDEAKKKLAAAASARGGWPEFASLVLYLFWNAVIDQLRRQAELDTMQTQTAAEAWTVTPRKLRQAVTRTLRSTPKDPLVEFLLATTDECVKASDSAAS